MSVFIKQETQDAFVPLHPTSQALKYRYFNGNGCNSKGNCYVKFKDSWGRKGYHYINTNGNYYIMDTDGTQYYNDGYGFARLTYLSGREIATNSQFTFQDFDLYNFNFDSYLEEFYPVLEKIKKEEYCD
ncbi:hypothetical protein BDN72DRAFT_955994 [Pluteus cervinus]|uniref:Uncharacterized protein n=1 Tax=Pluteus cervinus TaxID=181527 RepID=A0ACD3B931_9AGAR|nr:hypothetical protein BDN72DRAFT_955994 [Pluteus cervinus]